MSAERASVTKKDLIDYLGGTLSPSRQGELDAALADPHSPVWAVLREVQDTQRRKRGSRTPLPSADSTPGESRPAPATDAPKKVGHVPQPEPRKSAEPVPRHEPRARATAPPQPHVPPRLLSRGLFIAASVLFVAVLRFSPWPSPSGNRGAKSSHTRTPRSPRGLTEEGARDGKAASEMKQKAIRLKIELRRRLQVALAEHRVENPMPVRTGRWFTGRHCSTSCSASTAPASIRKSRRWKTCSARSRSTRASRRANSRPNSPSTRNYPPPLNEKERDAQQQERNAANTILTALDELAGQAFRLRPSARGESVRVRCSETLPGSD